MHWWVAILSFELKGMHQTSLTPAYSTLHLAIMKGNIFLVSIITYRFSSFANCGWKCNNYWGFREDKRYCCMGTSLLEWRHGTLSIRFSLVSNENVYITSSSQSQSLSIKITWRLSERTVFSLLGCLYLCQMEIYRTSAKLVSKNPTAGYWHLAFALLATCTL